MSSTVTTALYIGGKERQTAEKMAIADPAKPGVVVGFAASATPQDVSDAVTAAKAAYPAWSALTPQQRAEKMKAAIEARQELDVLRDANAAPAEGEQEKLKDEAPVVKESVAAASKKDPLASDPQLSAALLLLRMKVAAHL